MDASTLLARAISYGADEKGIEERLGGNADLFKLCFLSMLNEKNVAALDAAMEARDYSAAFQHAHALKGMTGNLGLTPYYEAICALVEDLRAADYSRVQAEYGEVRRQFALLQGLAADEG